MRPHWTNKPIKDEHKQRSVCLSSATRSLLSAFRRRSRSYFILGGMRQIKHFSLCLRCFACCNVLYVTVFFLSASECQWLRLHKDPFSSDCVFLCLMLRKVNLKLARALLFFFPSLALLPSACLSSLCAFSPSLRRKNSPRPQVGISNGPIYWAPVRTNQRSYRQVQHAFNKTPQ